MDRNQNSVILPVQIHHVETLELWIWKILLDTIREWLLRAANHSEKVNEIFLKDLKISKVELDELWTFVKKNQFREWQVRRKSGGFG